MNKKYPTLPFSIATFEDLTAAKVGVKECLSHELISPYPVQVEKVGEIVAQFKCTIAMLPKSAVILTGDLEFKEDQYEGDKKLENQAVKDILALDLWKKENYKCF